MTSIEDPSEQLECSIEIASCDAHFLAVKRIWHDVYYDELGWIGESDISECDVTPNGLSEYYIAFDPGGYPVGTMRVLFAELADLPTASLTHLNVPYEARQGNWAEFGRLMVIRQARRTRFDQYPFGVFAALFKFAIMRCRTRGINFIVTNVQCRGEELSLVNSLVMAGFRETGTLFHDEFSSENPPCTALWLDVGEIPLETTQPNPLKNYLYT